MIGSLGLLVSPSSTIALSLALLIVAIILFVGNVTIASAQQPPLTSQPVMTQNRVELFQSTEDGIRLNVPQGWLIQDLNNTGPVFSEESTRGYGILAQLCRGEEQQQQQRQQGQEGAAPVNANNTYGCQVAQKEVVHIVRYPNLDTGIQAANNSNSTTATAPPTSGASFNNNNQTIATTITIDNILAYHLQKLQQVGYNSIQIVNNVDTSVNLTMAQSNQTLTTLPAKFVEMTYTTASSAPPGETKRGYFLLTATNATAPDLGVTKGYSVFYEGSYISAETGPANSSAPTPLPEAARQVFDSFELVTAAATTTTAATQIEPPTVEIIASDTEDTAPATFEFEANVTGGTEPYVISWDFGDGSEEEDDEEDEDVEHTFDEAGSYSVSLTVTDSRGESASDSIEITVEEAPVVEEEQPTVEEEEEEEEGNDSVDVEGAVDDFIDDLFGRLGLR
jgi:PKD repeat protein